MKQNDKNVEEKEKNNYKIKKKCITKWNLKNITIRKSKVDKIKSLIINTLDISLLIVKL